MQLTQKETELIKDLKGQEKLCVEKFTKYSSVAKDPQLKNLFTKLDQAEQQHLNTVTDIENGKTPQMNAGSGSQTQMTFTATYGAGNDQNKQDDFYLCSDALSTEKHVSSSYNISVFEFSDENLRNTLNHIQKEEQEHGKMIYDYMSANNMYA